MMKTLLKIIPAAALLPAFALASAGPAAAQEEWDEQWDEEEDVEDRAETEAEKEDDFSVTDWIGGMIEWGGYYENQLMVGKLPRDLSDPDASDWKVTDTNKFRLDLTAMPVKKFRLDVDVILKTFHGTTSYHLADMLPEKFQPELAVWEASDPSSVKWNLDNEFYLDNAYLTVSLKQLRLRVGKQQVRFGSGYFWNPTDLFTVKDLVDPAYEKRGLTAVKLQFFFKEEGQIDLYYFFENGFEENMQKSGFMEGGRLGLLDEPSFVVRLRKHFYRWEVSTLFTMKKDAWIELSSPAPGMPPVIPELIIDDRIMGGFDFAGELGGAGLRGELAVNKIGRSTRFIEVLGSIDYTFRCGFYIMGEYLFTSRGKSGSENYSFEDWINYLTQSLKVPGMHYAAALLKYTFAGINLDLQLAGIVNASDGSFVLNPWITYIWGNFVTVSLYGAFSWGGDDTDELAGMGQGLFLRFKFAF